MKRFSDLRTTYLYLVCFAMLIIAAVGVVRAGSAALDLLIYRGESAYGPEYRPRVIVGKDGEVAVPPELLQAQEAHERQYRPDWPASGLVAGLSLFAWGLPLYVLHWRLIRREESRQRPATPWGPRPLYFYLVSAVALGMIVSGGHQAIVQAAGTESYVWTPGPLEIYERSVHEPGEPMTVAEAVAEAERTRARDLSYHRYSRWRRIAGAVLVLAVGLALYVPHWRWASQRAAGND